MKKQFFLGAVLCLLLSACGKQEQAQSTPDIKQHLQLMEVAESPFETTYITVGTVRAEAGKLADVGLPMDGRIGECFVRLGQMVKAGTPLFSVHSPEFADQCKAYFQAESNCELRQRDYSRKQTLKESGIVSERELDEAANEWELARRELRQWEHTMLALGLDIKSLKETGAMNIIAPIAGEVVRLELTTGQYVRADETAPVTIADLSTVWVAARLKEYYIDRVHQDDAVDVMLHTNGDLRVSGRVVYIGQLLDEETRSVEVLVACQNPDKKMKPGMFAHVHFTSPEQAAIQVPASAIMQGDNAAFVYVLQSDSTFARREVSVETGKEGMVHVISGLAVGETIVAEGGIFINE